MNRVLTTTAISCLMIGAAMAQTSVTGSGNVTGGAGVTVDGSGVNIGGTAGADAGAGANTSVGDTTVTGSTSATASGSATAAADSGFINQLGDNADQFFTGQNNGQLRPDAEITANFTALPADQQAKIRSQCSDLDSSTTNSQVINDFCTKIKSM
jgi:hypothetical protein